MPEMKNTDIDLRLVQAWLKEAGDIAMGRRDSLTAACKHDGSLVTDVDHQIETYLYKQVSQYYPGHQILAEEGARLGNDGEYLWTIDPIDGTRAYASGLPIWGISIGILKRGEPYAGLFSMPATGELYVGVGEKAFFNNRLLSSAVMVDIQSPTAFLAVPSNAHRLFEISFGRLRSLGSSTAHLAYVARGVAVAALTRPLYIWDIAPVMSLLRATGIALIYLSGRKFELQQLLDASPSPEPLIAAPVNLIENIRMLVRNKPPE
ncbi:MAG: inositol monophosphatase [Chloroflexi bacterium]|nr:MAG: inositol monophosphatase [Chloroflexota bacterium]